MLNISVDTPCQDNKPETKLPVIKKAGKENTSDIQSNNSSQGYTSKIRSFGTKDLNISSNMQRRDQNSLKAKVKRTNVRSLNSEANKLSNHIKSRPQKENSEPSETQKFQHQKANSISEPINVTTRPKIRAINAGYMGDGSDINGDTEPVLPTIIYIHKETEELPPCVVNEANQEGCKTRRRCLCNCSKAKTDTNLSQLSLKKNISACTSRTNIQAISSHVASVGCIVVEESVNDLNDESMIKESADKEKLEKNLDSSLANKLKKIVSKSTRANSCRPNSQAPLQNLDAKQFDVESLKVNLAQTVKSPMATRKPFIKPSYNGIHSKKSTQLPSLDVSTPLAQAPGILTKTRPTRNRLPKNQNNDNNIQMNSLLLGPVSNDFKSLKNFIKADQKGRRHNISNIMTTTPSSTADCPENLAKFEVSKRIRTPRPTQQNSLLNSNTLVRGIYRVKRESSAKSEDVRSQEDPNINQNNVEVPQLKNELCTETVPVQPDKENMTQDKNQNQIKEHGRRLSDLSLVETSNLVGPTSRSKSANYRSNTPNKNSGASFNKNKRLDMVRLPLIQDVNKMLDPVQRLSRAL